MLGDRLGAGLHREQGGQMRLEAGSLTLTGGTEVSEPYTWAANAARVGLEAAGCRNRGPVESDLISSPPNPPCPSGVHLLNRPVRPTVVFTSSACAGLGFAGSFWP